MLENVHKRLEQAPASGTARLAALQQAMVEVGPPLFFSLLIITISFLPVFALEAQEGRLFAPLAYTKTYAMAAAAGLSVTLVPALIVYLVRGRIREEKVNPLNRVLVGAYRVVIGAALRRPRATLWLALLLVATSLWPLTRLGSEFMPRLDEGDLLYMPTTLPGLSAGKAQQLLQQTDRLIKTMPEVDRVFGKIGQAETATDPAPLTMMEATIRLKPHDQWRSGMTLPMLIAELDERVRIPGVTNSWQMPIAARIDMLATGIKTPLGVKVSGPDLHVIETIGVQIEGLLRPLPGTASVYAERAGSARYIEIDVDRDSAAHYGLSVADIYEVISMTVGGMNITYTVEGRERYPINVRYPPEARNSLTALKDLPVFLPTGQQIRLADVADVAIKDGPEMIKSEDARLSGWVYVDIKGRDLGSYVADAQRVVTQHVKLPPGYSIGWSGQYQYLTRASERLGYIVPLTLVLIFLLLYLNFRNMTEALMVMGALPIALVGGIWLLFALDYQLSVAVGVGFIALAGVAAEFGVVMLVYLDQAMQRHRPATLAQLHVAVIDGAVLRVHPKAMTVAVVVAALLPIMLGGGTGSEVMRRIAAPMIGGMITAPLVSMLVIPVLYVLWKQRGLAKK
jgi:Cu(I)/Ag(I) efflux system membrane protein CusA/SilA